MAYASNKEMFDVFGPVFSVAKTGKQLCIMDEDTKDKVWFGVFNADDLKGAARGDVVEFKYSVSGNFNNIAPKTFKIVKKVAPVVAPGGNGVGGNGGTSNVGVEIGMSINNAVAIAIAEKNTDISNIKKIALEIYRMSSDMRDYVLKEKADKAAKAAEAANDKQEVEAEPQAEEKPKPKQGKPAANPTPFDDDVPF